jgi:hypothetical protein
MPAGYSEQGTTAGGAGRLAQPNSLSGVSPGEIGAAVEPKALIGCSLSV